ncbi:MAG: hypothetical protein JWR19_2180 [Pedosphaera sp.]|nr:hypothetical protein [Pedosphaera sp.]
MSQPTVLMIEDDAQCLRILSEAGLLNALTPRPGKDTACTSFEHGEFRCLACYHYGHTNPADNGYLVVMMPKSIFSEQDAAVFFAGIISEFGQMNQNPIEYSSIAPVTNS